MSFYCKNGPVHRHETSEESRRCWFPSTVPAPPIAASPVPLTPAEPMISGRQKKYINDLGGHWEVDWTYKRASDEITRLVAEKKGRAKVDDPRLKMMESMITFIPDGYYATAADGPGGHVDFIRLSRPTKGQYRGCIKVQTQHSERWETALIKWPSGHWQVYKGGIVEILLLVIADYHTCAKRYSIEKQSCMVCNTTLTDDRSRHYLIGPICDKKDSWKWVIEEVDNKNNGLSFEALVARGLPTRIWQDKELRSA